MNDSIINLYQSYLAHYLVTNSERSCSRLPSSSLFLAIRSKTIFGLGSSRPSGQQPCLSPEMTGTTGASGVTGGCRSGFGCRPHSMAASVGRSTLQLPTAGLTPVACGCPIAGRDASGLLGGRGSAGLPRSTVGGRG